MSDLTTPVRSPEVDGLVEMMQFVKDGQRSSEIHKLERKILHERATAALANTERTTRLNTWVDMSARRRISGYQSDTVSKDVKGRQRTLPYPTEYGDFELVLTNIFLKPTGEAYGSSAVRIALCNAGTSEKPISPWYDQGLTLAEFSDLPPLSGRDAVFTDHRDTEALLALFEQ